MFRSFAHRVTALALTALMLAAHVPVPAGAMASKMACCGPKACCQAERACTSGGACATHSDHAQAAPIVPSLPMLLAGNCGDPTPRVAPVSYDPVTQPRHTTVRAEAAIAELPIVPTHPAPEHDPTPSVPPPRA